MRDCPARPQTPSAPPTIASLPAAVPAPIAACTSRAQPRLTASPAGSTFFKFKERLEELESWFSQGILTKEERDIEVAKAKDQYGIGK